MSCLSSEPDRKNISSRRLSSPCILEKATLGRVRRRTGHAKDDGARGWGKCPAGNHDSHLPEAMHTDRRQAAPMKNEAKKKLAACAQIATLAYLCTDRCTGHYCQKALCLGDSGASFFPLFCCDFFCYIRKEK